MEKRIRIGWAGPLLLVVLTALLHGCGGDGGSTADDNGLYRGKVYVVGELEGDVGDVLRNSLATSLPYDGQAHDAPIIIAGSEVQRLSGGGAAGISGAYRARLPIILVRATQEQANALLGLLGLEQNYELPEGLAADRAYADIFAVDTEAGGDSYTWSSYPPLPSPDGKEPSLIQEDWVSSYQSGSQVTELLLEWLRDDGRRTEKEQAAREAAGQAIAQTADGKNLVDIAMKYVDSKVYRTRCSAKISNADNAGKDRKFGTGTYQFHHYYYAAHSFNTTDGMDSDWLYVQQRASFNLSNCFQYASKCRLFEDVRMPSRDVNHDRYYYECCKYGDIVLFTDCCGDYASSYKLDSWIAGQDKSSTNLVLVEHSPATDSNVATVKSSITMNFGGKVGFSKDGPSGEVSGGVTINHSQEVKVPDTWVLNDSLTTVHNARWSYTFKGSEVFQKGLFWAALHKPADVSYMNFSLLNQWVWKAGPALRDDPNAKKFRVKFSAQKKRTYGEGCVLSICKSVDVLDPPDEIIFTVPLTYPPLLATAPTSLSFKAAADTQKVELAVSGNWNASCDQPWCTVFPQSGTHDALLLQVMVDENKTDPRQAHVTIRRADGKGETKITVLQSKN